MTFVATCTFREPVKTYYLEPGELELHVDSPIIAETARGLEMGRVKFLPREVNDTAIVPPLRAIVRLASPEDIERDVVLSHGHLLHVFRYGAGLEHLQRHAAVETDRGNTRLHGAEVRRRMQHAGGRDEHVDVRPHHAFADGGGRVVVIGWTALEERNRDIRAELAQDALNDLPDPRIV